MQASAQSTAALYRRLTWQATVPLEIRLSTADGEPQHGGGVERYYMQVSRHSYLPLILKEIKENYVQAAVLDDDLSKTKETDWWFEEDVGGQDGDGYGQELIGDVGKGGLGAGEACPWHWPIDIIHTRQIISKPIYRSSSPSSSTSSPTPPLRLILHLLPPPRSSPHHDQLYALPNTIESCKAQFQAQLKEGDFVRWGNTRRITGLRRLDLEGGWEGLVDNDFDAISRFQSKILPLPLPPATSLHSLQLTSSHSSGSSSAESRIPVADPTSGIGSAGLAAQSKGESVYTCKAIPVRFYLPGGVMHIQENVPPLQADGTPTTVLQMLQQNLTHLFPSRSSNPPDPYPLAIPILSGVELPPDAEVGWLGSCCCGPDGWLRFGIRLVEMRS